MATAHTMVQDLNGFGSLLYAPEFQSAPQVLSPAAFAAQGSIITLPAVVSLGNVPPVPTQGTAKNPGSPGSCEAQSFAYGLGSYTAARNADGTVKWEVSDAENQVSAAFLYNYMHHQENRVCPKGSLATPYLNYLIANGSPSASDIPYHPDCTYLNGLPLDPAFPGMTRFCLGSFAAFSISRDPGYALLLIKQLLANRLAVAFSGPVLTDYMHPAFTDGVIYETKTVPKSGHGQVVVGYDDTIGTATNPGALLIQNSMGIDWPGAKSGSSAPAGQAYWGYDSFTGTQLLAATAYPLNLSPVTGVKLSTASQIDAYVNTAFQWAPASGDVWIIIILQLSVPIRLQRLQLTEPGTNTTIGGSYGPHITNGYLYFRRSDGNQFLSGDYGILLSGTDSTGASIQFAGSVTIGAAQPANPPAQSVTSTTTITDQTNAPATIVIGSRA